MNYALVPHSDHPPRAVTGVTVSLARAADRLSLDYSVAGAAQMPPQRSPVRTDGLWQTTCFELFLMLDDDEHYVEFNFSPSTQWAAYSFDGHREGMADLPLDLPPLVVPRSDGVEVTLDLAALPYGPLRMALSVVIEEADGTKSFWALAHPAGAPDFHHAACFAARLPAPEAA